MAILDIYTKNGDATSPGIPEQLVKVIFSNGESVERLIIPLDTIKTAPDIKFALDAGIDLTNLVGRTITCNNGNMRWEVADYDDINHEVTLLTTFATKDSTIAFEPVQATGYYQNGLPTGPYKFSEVAGLSYYFTLTRAIPPGGQISLTSSSFKTYASQNATTALESGSCSSRELANAVDLGVCGQELNNLFRQQAGGGSNNFGESGLFAWLNSNAPANTLMPRVNKYSRPYSVGQPGFKAQVDSDFLNAIAESEWKCAASSAYEAPPEFGGIAVKGQPYTVTGKFALASQKEIFGSYDRVDDGSSIFDLYTSAEDADRIKYTSSGTASSWWLRSPSGGSPVNVHTVTYAGKLGSTGSSTTGNSCGLVIACKIKKTGNPNSIVYTEPVSVDDIFLDDGYDDEYGVLCGIQGSNTFNIAEIIDGVVHIKDHEIDYSGEDSSLIFIYANHVVEYYENGELKRTEYVYGDGEVDYILPNWSTQSGKNLIGYSINGQVYRPGDTITLIKNIKVNAILSDISQVPEANIVEPILFGPNGEPSDGNNLFSGSGYGRMIDATEWHVEEELNGEYELNMVYPASGPLFEYIHRRAIIRAKVSPFTTKTQDFRIYDITKPINGLIEIRARHISYDLSGVIVKGFTANNPSSAMVAITNNQIVASGFTFTTSVSATKDLVISAPTSVRAALGDGGSSVLGCYGGEFEWDNKLVKHSLNRGQKKPVRIAYGINMVDFKQEENIANCVTSVVGYVRHEDAFIYGNLIRANGFDYDNAIAVDFTSKWDSDSTPTVSQIDSMTRDYMSLESSNIGKPEISIEVSYAQLSRALNISAPPSYYDALDVGDIITIYFEKLGIDVEAEVISKNYNGKLDRYDSIGVGDRAKNLSDTILAQSTVLEKTVTNDFMADAIAEATRLITGNLGGNVIIHDSDNDGKPDEILIINTDKIEDATEVWRWNKGGLGFASGPNAYYGPYALAMTNNGHIVGSRIDVTGMTVGSANIADAAITNAKIDTLTANKINGGTFDTNRSSIGGYITVPKEFSVVGSAESKVTGAQCVNFEATSILSSPGQTFLGSEYDIFVIPSGGNPTPLATYVRDKAATAAVFG